MAVDFFEMESLDGFSFIVSVITVATPRACRWTFLFILFSLFLSFFRVRFSISYYVNMIEKFEFHTDFDSRLNPLT